MSWDSYIDNLMGQTQGNADKAAIIGLDGGAPWTTASHANAIQFIGNEAAELASVLASNDVSHFQANGIFVEGMKYQFLRYEDGSILLGKKKDNGAITAITTKTAIVIAHTKEGGQHGETNKGTSVIAEYLTSLGY